MSAVSMAMTTTAITLMAAAVLLLIGATTTQLQNGKGLPRLADFRRFRRAWTIVFPDGTHRLELEHHYINGRKQVWWDGESLGNWQKLFDFRSIYRFVLGDHKCTLLIRAQGIGYRYSLAIDGLWLDRMEQPTTGDVPLWSMLFYAVVVAPILLDPARRMTYLASAAGLLGCRAAVALGRVTATQLSLSVIMLITTWSIYLFSLAGR